MVLLDGATDAPSVLMGRQLLIGITDYDTGGKLIGQRQMCGRIVDIERGGITVQLHNASYFELPPDPRPIKRARKGQYTLRSTGEVVNDPDYSCSYSIYKH